MDTLAVLTALRSLLILSPPDNDKRDQREGCEEPPRRNWSSILCKYPHWHCAEKRLQRRQLGGYCPGSRWSWETGPGPPGGRVDRMDRNPQPFPKNHLTASSYCVVAVMGSLCDFSPPRPSTLFTVLLSSGPKENRAVPGATTSGLALAVSGLALGLRVAFTTPLAACSAYT